jgi:hypothetical protein
LIAAVAATKRFGYKMQLPGSVQVLDCATRITVNKTASGKQSWTEDAEPDRGYSYIRTKLFTLKCVRARRGKAGAVTKAIQRQQKLIPSAAKGYKMRRPNHGNNARCVIG